MPEMKDILLVESVDGSPVLIEAPLCKVSVGKLVAYDGGKYGTVQKLISVSDNEIVEFLSYLAPIYKLEEAFTSVWKSSERGAADVPGAS